LGARFFIGAIGIAGLPPFAGFAAKVYVLQSALAHPAAYWMLALILGTGLLVIVALGRAGSAIFWRTADTVPSAGHAAAIRLAATAALLAAPLLLMLAAGPVTAYTRATAAQLADRAGYVAAVMANRGVSPPAHQDPHSGGEAHP
jgi:multicomponent K+:H+ antiporter subunit D